MNGITPTIGIQPFNVIQDWGAQSSLSNSRRYTPYPYKSPFMTIANRSGCGPGPRPPSVPLDERVRIYGNHPGTPFDKSPFEENSKRNVNFHPISMARLPMSMYASLMEGEENKAKQAANDEIIQAQLFIPNIFKKMEMTKKLIEDGDLPHGTEPKYTEAEKAYLSHIGTHDLDKIKQILINMSKQLQEVAETRPAENPLETGTVTEGATENPAITGEDAEEEVDVGDNLETVGEEEEGDAVGAEEEKEDFIDEDEELARFRDLLDGNRYVIKRADIDIYSDKRRIDARIAEILSILSNSLVNITDKITGLVGRPVSFLQIRKDLNAGNSLIVDKETGEIYLEPQSSGPGVGEDMM